LRLCGFLCAFAPLRETLQAVEEVIAKAQGKTQRRKMSSEPAPNRGRDQTIPLPAALFGFRAAQVQTGTSIEGDPLPKVAPALDLTRSRGGR
ncbi:MAG: hypothetical protein WBQ66_07055, partial [Blastocatellia bacterium]